MSRYKGDIHVGRVYCGGSEKHLFRKVLKIPGSRVDYSVCDEAGVPFGKKGFCNYANFQLWAREEISNEKN